jgi:homopolymeric O-antigen transport system ATP-binding protein
VAHEGRTVLFVSHNMIAVERLCGRAIVLAQGQLDYDGGSREAVQKYVESFQVKGRIRKTGVGEFDLNDAPRGGKFAQSTTHAFRSLSIRNSKGLATDAVTCGEDVTFVIRYEYAAPLMTPTVGIVFSIEPGGRLAFVQTRIQYGEIPVLPHQGELVCKIPRLPLAPGCYTLSFGLNAAGQQIDWIEDQIELHIEPADFFGTGQLPPSSHGPLLLAARWELP